MPFEAGNIYHIYNRSIDRKPLFVQDRNYVFFLNKLDFYLSPFIDVFAWCLMNNHFHLMARIKDLADFQEWYKLTNPGLSGGSKLTTFQKLPTLVNQKLPTLAEQKLPTLAEQKLPTLAEQKLPTSKKLPTLQMPTYEDVPAIVSHAFQKMFQSYAMAFNRQQSRIGSLFQSPLKRNLVDSEEYFTNLIYYIHANAQLHGFVDDFRLYPWSSYNRIFSTKPSKLQKEQVLNWFGGADRYQEYHSSNPRILDSGIVIEDD